MNLRAIVYASEAIPGLSNERIHDLAQSAYRFNLQAGVTGVLLYDGRRFFQYWQVYRPTPDGSRYFFSNPGDASFSPDQEIVWQKIEVALGRMRLLLPKLLSHVRHEYVEIDI